MPFTIFDLALLIVMLLSGILAMFRGFSREVLSILSWVAAAAAGFYVFREYPNALSSYISDEKIAMAAIVGLTFLVVLVFASLITMKLSDALLDSGIGALDRTLGFLFGMARGLILVAIMHVFYAVYFDKTARYQFPMIEESYSKPYVAATGEKLKNIMIDIFERFQDSYSDEDI